MLCKNNLSGTNIEEFIRGITEEYKVASGGKIEAGDFVTFFSDYTKNDEVHNITLNSAGSGAHAVALSENTIFVTFVNTYLYGLVCTVEDNNISLGTATRLCATQGISSSFLDICALDENKVCIVHTGNNSAGYNTYRYAIVCTVSKTTITVGDDRLIITSIPEISGATMNDIKITRLSASRAFVAYTGGYGAYKSRLYGMILNISDTSVSSAGNKTLIATDYTGHAIAITALSETRVFIAHSNMNVSNIGNRLNGIVCTVSGNTITAGTDAQISSLQYSGVYISIDTISNNKVIISTAGSSSYCLYAMICTIYDTGFMTGNIFQVCASANSGRYNKITVLNEERACISYTDNCLYTRVLTISGTTITFTTNSPAIKLSESSVTDVNSLIALTESKICIVRNAMLAMIVSYFVTLAKTITSSTEKIDGIAITSATSGQTVQVKVPNVK